MNLYTTSALALLAQVSHADDERDTHTHKGPKLNETPFPMPINQQHRCDITPLHAMHLFIGSYHPATPSTFLKNSLTRPTSMPLPAPIPVSPEKPLSLSTAASKLPSELSTFSSATLVHRLTTFRYCASSSPFRRRRSAANAFKFLTFVVYAASRARKTGGDGNDARYAACAGDGASDGFCDHAVGGIEVLGRLAMWTSRLRSASPMLDTPLGMCVGGAASAAVGFL